MDPLTLFQLGSPLERAIENELAQHRRQQGLPGWDDVPKSVKQNAASLCPNFRDQSIEILDAQGNTVYVVEDCEISLNQYVHVSTDTAFRFAVENKKLPPLWSASAGEASRHGSENQPAKQFPPGVAVRLPPEASPTHFSTTDGETRGKRSGDVLAVVGFDSSPFGNYRLDLCEPRPLVDSTDLSYSNLPDAAHYLTPENMEPRQPDSSGQTVAEIMTARATTADAQKSDASTRAEVDQPAPDTTEQALPSKEQSQNNSQPSKGKEAPPAHVSGKPAYKPRGPGASGAVVRKTTKQLFWDALDVTDADTFWTKKGTLDACIDISDIQEVFARAAPKALDSKGVKTFTEKPRAISLLTDSKRVYSMSISLARFSKLSWLELRRAILELDPQVLTVETTDVLLKFAPQPDETEVVTQFIKEGGQVALLDRPEQFVAAMIGVPLFYQRLSFHRFASGFCDLSQSVAAPLYHVSRAVEEVVGCDKLKVVLLIILKIGNEINTKSATAFRFTTLNKLNDVRTTTKPVRTMLQYIGNIVYEQRPELLELVQDLGTVPKAAKVDVVEIDRGIAEIRSGINQTKTTLKLAESNRKETDVLVPIAIDFLGLAERRLAELSSAVDEVQTNFLRLLKYFGENDRSAAKVTPPEFFKSLDQFVRTLKAVEKERKDQDATKQVK